MKLKVMALGNIMTLTRLYASMSQDNFDLVGISGVSEALNRLEKERFDVILIDSLIDEVSYACRYIYEKACAPIALLFRETGANWQNLYSLKVDGFVPEESGQKELAQRLIAISRRNV